MSAIGSPLGSVFLGDFQRHRLLSISTPPTSPPPPMSPTSATAAQAFAADTIEEDSPVLVSPPLPAQTPQAPPPSIDPVQSLELRLRWLEALLYGVKPEGSSRTHHPRGASASGPSQDRRHGPKTGETLVRSAEEVKRRMDSVVEGNDGLRRFVEHCALSSILSEGTPDDSPSCLIDEQHGHLLTPSFALSGTLPTTPPTYQNMSSTELEAFLAELEPDIRAADRDMREIEMCEKKGVTAAGKLPGMYLRSITVLERSCARESRRY